jgi:plastocyanin
MNLFRACIVAAAVALVATATASTMSHPRLIGTVGPGFTISLKHNGVLVKTLKAGTYTFVVSDKANIHNFQLKGPGLNRALSSVAFVGAKTVTLTLKRGLYTYYCVPHASSIHGSFRVT